MCAEVEVIEAVEEMERYVVREKEEEVVLHCQRS